MNKAELREKVLSEFSRQTPTALQGKSQQICSWLFNLSDIAVAKNVALYYPFGKEVNLIPLFEMLAQRGQDIFLPKFYGEELRLVNYRLGEETTKTSLGFRQPSGNDFLETQHMDAICVPGLGFDSQGHRLGRGKGYYDKLLVGALCKKIGIGFAFQLLPTMPVEAHDIRMDIVVTEREVLRCG